MKKLSIEQWAAVSICIAIPAFLMYQNHDSGIFGTAVISYAALAGIEEWNNSDETTKQFMSFNNPHKKEEYKWIRDLGL